MSEIRTASCYKLCGQILAVNKWVRGRFTLHKCTLTLHFSVRSHIIPAKHQYQLDAEEVFKVQVGNVSEVE